MPLDFVPGRETITLYSSVSRHKTDVSQSYWGKAMERSVSHTGLVIGQLR